MYADVFFLMIDRDRPAKMTGLLRPLELRP